MLQLTDGILYTGPTQDTDRPVLAIIAGSKRSLMVDGGNSPRHAEAFLDELSRHHQRMPDFVALTHAHCDHIFGLSSLDSVIIANKITNDRIMELQQLHWDDDSVAIRVANGQEHEMTAHMLKVEMPGDRRGFRICSPDLIYESKLAIDLGDLTCHLQWIGGDHAADSAVIFVPERKVAFIGDCLYLRHTERATVRKLSEQLLSFPADVYIDSHEAEPISRHELIGRLSTLPSA